MHRDVSPNLIFNSNDLNEYLMSFLCIFATLVTYIEGFEGKKSHTFSQQFLFLTNAQFVQGSALYFATHLIFTVGPVSQSV